MPEGIPPNKQQNGNSQHSQQNVDRRHPYTEAAAN